MRVLRREAVCTIYGLTFAEWYPREHAWPLSEQRLGEGALKRASTRRSLGGRQQASEARIGEYRGVSG